MTNLSLRDIIFSRNERKGGDNLRKYLKELRKKSGLKQSDMAEKLGIADSSYTMVELGERQKDMSLSFAEKLSKVLDVPVSLIMEEEAKLRNVMR